MPTTEVLPALDFAAIWAAALPYGRFVAQARNNRDLWEAVYRTARLPAWAVQRVRALSRPVRLLAIVEDWCGDASNTVPVIARLADETDGLELRVLLRDDNPGVMNRYLTNGTRSIPIVIALDSEFRETGHWGPRPAELQAWVMAHKDTMARAERYHEVRRWYARDRGESTLREVLALLA